MRVPTGGCETEDVVEEDLGDIETVEMVEGTEENVSTSANKDFEVQKKIEKSRIIKSETFRYFG